jgi:GNAT superfamily N-acetyltransferase
MTEVVPATSPEEVEEAASFRRGLLAFGPGDATEADVDRDPTTVHCLVRDGEGTCIGAGRLVAPTDTEDGGERVEGNPIIGPIVVAESERGKGIGRAILAFLEDEALAIYGSNGTVRVEAWVPDRMARGAGTVGYTVKEGHPANQGAPTQVFRDIMAGIDDSRRGPAVA